MSLASLTQLKDFYENAEREYLEALPLEHFMEASDHAHQRRITLASFDAICESRPDIQLFSEMLVQYPWASGDRVLGQVVPDNFVAAYHEPLDVDGSFNTPLQPVGPFLVMEYVSRHTKRKDYVDNYQKYQHELKVPHYLRFYPYNLELSVFRLAENRYVAVEPNAAGRREIPELELEVALLDGWVRYWFRGELVPLPGEFFNQLKLTKNQVLAMQDQIAAAQDEIARMKAELDRLRGDS